MTRHILTVDSKCLWCCGRGFVSDVSATHPCRCVRAESIAAVCYGPRVDVAGLAVKASHVESAGPMPDPIACWLAGLSSTGTMADVFHQAIARGAYERAHAEIVAVVRAAVEVRDGRRDASMARLELDDALEALRAKLNGEMG